MKLAFGNGMTRAKLCTESLTFTASGQRLVLTREQVSASCTYLAPGGDKEIGGCILCMIYAGHLLRCDFRKPQTSAQGLTFPRAGGTSDCG
jgi:hypothetical protein